MQRQAKEAIVGKLKHQRRKLTVAEQGASLTNVGEDVLDTTHQVCDEWVGQQADNFNDCFEKTFSTKSALPMRYKETQSTDPAHPVTSENPNP